MRVQTDQAQHRKFGEAGEDGAELGTREAELRVLAAGADERVRVRFDAGVDAQHHVDGCSSGRQCGEALEFLVIVDDVEGHAAVDDGLQFGLRLSAAMEVHASGGEAAAFGRDEFAERADIEPQRGRSKMLGERRTQKRLGRVGDRNPVRCTGARETVDLQIEHVEIDEKQRRAVRFGEFARRNAGDPAFHRSLLRHW